MDLIQLRVKYVAAVDPNQQQQQQNLNANINNSNSKIRTLQFKRDSTIKDALKLIASHNENCNNANGSSTPTNDLSKKKYFYFSNANAKKYIYLFKLNKMIYCFLFKRSDFISSFY
jgi:hypothetical protein